VPGAEVKTTAPSVLTLARLLPDCLPLEHKRDSHSNLRHLSTSLHFCLKTSAPFPTLLLKLPPASHHLKKSDLVNMSDHSKKLAHELGGYERIGGKHYDSMIRVHPRGKISSMTDLWVSFERTVRVSDNGNVNSLPPSLGHFPIFNTSNYEKTLPAPMAAKDGYFLPMHRMCCHFLCANTC
jgi:hypothetical protein